MFAGSGAEPLATLHGHSCQRGHCHRHGTPVSAATRSGSQCLPDGGAGADCAGAHQLCQAILSRPAAVRGKATA